MFHPNGSILAVIAKPHSAASAQILCGRLSPLSLFQLRLPALFPLRNNCIANALGLGCPIPVAPLFIFWSVAIG